MSQSVSIPALMHEALVSSMQMATIAHGRVEANYAFGVVRAGTHDRVMPPAIVLVSLNGDQRPCSCSSPRKAYFRLLVVDSLTPSGMAVSLRTSISAICTSKRTEAPHEARAIPQGAA